MSNPKRGNNYSTLETSSLDQLQILYIFLWLKVITYSDKMQTDFLCESCMWAVVAFNPGFYFHLPLMPSKGYCLFCVFSHIRMRSFGSHLWYLPESWLPRLKAIMYFTTAFTNNMDYFGVKNYDLLLLISIHLVSLSISMKRKPLCALITYTCSTSSDSI